PGRVRRSRTPCCRRRTSGSATPRRSAGTSCASRSRSLEGPREGTTEQAEAVRRVDVVEGAEGVGGHSKSSESLPEPHEQAAEDVFSLEDRVVPGDGLRAPEGVPPRLLDDRQ